MKELRDKERRGMILSELAEKLWELRFVIKKIHSHAKLEINVDKLTHSLLSHEASSMKFYRTDQFLETGINQNQENKIKTFYGCKFGIIENEVGSENNNSAFIKP